MDLHLRFFAPTWQYRSNAIDAPWRFSPATLRVFNHRISGSRLHNHPKRKTCGKNLYRVDVGVVGAPAVADSILQSFKLSILQTSAFARARANVTTRASSL